MNPLTNMKNVKKLSEQELYAGFKTSWHDQYRESAWIFVGGLPYDLTEGDIICIFSQYGEIVNINLIRDKESGKSKGFCFICYEDQRSTDLAVDNLNGISVLKRTIRVDHVQEYKVPKEGKKTDEETKKLYQEGCAPKAKVILPVFVQKINDEYKRETLADQITPDIKLPERLPITAIKREKTDDYSDVKPKKEKKDKKKKSKKKKSKKKKSKKVDTSSEDEDSSDSDEHSKPKKKKRENLEELSGKSTKDHELKYRDFQSVRSNSRDRSEKRSPSPSYNKRRYDSNYKDFKRSSSTAYERNDLKKYRNRSRSRSIERVSRDYKRK